MSLSRKYRIKFAQKGDRLILFLAVAVVFHGGIVVLGSRAWQAQPDQSQPEHRQSIEFVYLSPEPEVSVNAERRANVSAVAGGEQKPELPVNAGKPGPQTSASTVVEQADKPVVSAQPSSGTLIPTSSDSLSTKALEPETPSKENTQTPAASTEDNQTAIAPSITPQPLPSLEPQPPLAPSPAIDPAPSAQARANQSSAISSAQDPGSMGQGLDGQLNPNRTALAPGAIDTQEDRIWGPYIAQLNREIYQHWNRISPDATRQTKVRFTIDRQGQLVDLQLVQSSGSELADELALQAIQNAAPFQPLPPNASEQQLIVNFTFTHNIRSLDIPNGL